MVLVETETIGYFDSMLFSMDKNQTKQIQFKAMNNIGDKITFITSC